MGSTVYEALNEKKEKILSQWQSVIFSSYANETIGQKPGSRFSNPIGYVIEKSSTEIMEWLLNVENHGELAAALEDICRLKAIQEFKPSEALSFIFALKQIIREELKDENGSNYWEIEIGYIDKKIDEVGLHAFDIYSECRAKIYEIRMDEIKRMYGRDAG